jgi:transposase
MDELDADQRLLPLSRLIVQEVINRLREDGLVLAAEARSVAPSSEDQEERIALKVAAQMLGHGYFWLSRNYMRLGLRPSRIGGKLLFERKEIERLLNERKVRAVGRPRIARFVQ